MGQAEQRLADLLSQLGSLLHADFAVDTSVIGVESVMRRVSWFMHLASVDTRFQVCTKLHPSPSFVKNVYKLHEVITIICL